MKDLEMLMWSLQADSFHFPGRHEVPAKRGFTSLTYTDLGKKMLTVNQDINITQSESDTELQFSNYFQGLLIL